MTNTYFGASTRRLEDPKLLMGCAQFVDDVVQRQMLHATFVRSREAHGKILNIDTKAAREFEGVVAVYTAQDLGDYNQSAPLVVPPPPIDDLEFNKRTQTPLAAGKVRYVGEPVAVVIAQNRYIAEDAADLVSVQIEPLSVVSDSENAVSENSPLVHEDTPGNRAAVAHQFKGDYAKAAAGAAVIVKRRFTYEHGLAQPMETRGVVAMWDAGPEKLQVWASTQAPTSLRTGLAGLLNLSESQIRIVAPFVGGGFGSKVLMYYPEEVLIPWVSIQLGRAVKWIEDRAEHFTATTQERGQIHDAELAVDESGVILGLKDRFLHDTGAYNPYGLTVPINSQCSALGPYVIPNYDSVFTAVFTNKPIVSPFRGAGRQHGVFVIERLLDLAAKELDLDVAEIRRRNFIPKDAFPYRNGVTFQDFTELSYDSGDYEKVLDQLLTNIDYTKFKQEEQNRLRDEGRYVGIGIVSYVEGTGIGPYEGARVRVQGNGRVNVATGIGNQGQGHYTSFAQIVADQLGVSPSFVDVTTGDTDQFQWGAGTFASRGAVVAGNAVYQAAEAVRTKIIELSASHLNCNKSQIQLGEGLAFDSRNAENSISFGDLAAIANPMRGAVAPGTQPGLEATSYFGPEGGTTSSGAHGLIVEVDPETLMVEIVRYVVVHDCGVEINPMIVSGQVKGGVVQGIGNAFFERIEYDDNGQLLNGTLADYLVPTSLEAPKIEVDHHTVPSAQNNLGIKGVGEAGAIPVGPVFAQAVEDALRPLSKELEVLDIPLSPYRLWKLLENSKPGTDTIG